MKADIVPLDSITADPHNANKHSERGEFFVRQSMQKFGYAEAGTLDVNNKIIGGNLRTEVAYDVLDATEAIVIDVDGTKPVYIRRNDIDLDTAEGRELAVALNRSAEVSITWDADILKDYDLAGIELGDWFTGLELGEFGIDSSGGAAGTADAEAQVSRADELQKEWQTTTGQLWKLPSRTAGQAHYLICGDCTDKATVERVMMGEKADMVFTDPPYGVDYDGGLNEQKRKKIAGDKDGGVYLPALRSLKLACRDNAPMYVWFADRGGKPVYDAVEAIGYMVRAMIVWNKLDAHYGNFMAQYMQKHEPCLYIVNGNASWAGPTNEVTVWDLKQPTVNEYHPAQKPTELATRAIKNHDAPIVADFFLGSGSTLIVAENLGRQLRGCEIDAGYCAVVLQRYLDAFGIRPELVE